MGSTTMEKKQLLADKIRQLIKKMMESGDRPLVNTSRYISEKLQLNYTYLSNVFSEVYGQSIEQFIIHCKIDQAKSMLLENHAVIQEVAARLNYSSNAHFSTQFKAVTGIRPSEFMRMQRNQPSEVGST
ncbi:MAG: AraC family transcriptional regulator [Sphingobacteriales bacterium]|nr:MAG: AraC family transcriptional regulator [Sphingobacteriales bacterium]